ncbi:amidase, partial [Mycobacterium tuberculosis]|nr:amidase [Mycobacterium tuberculosis]
LGPLAGVPVTVKALIATAGTPIPLGTAATELTPAAADAPTAARLREDGAVLFAKTTCPDYGMLSSGLSSFHPLSRNPWKLSENPGGSSAGAAAAGAAGFGPLHIGTDIGGSVRLPAGWTGLFGFKPSLGRIP